MDESRAETDDDYEVLRIAISWGLVSILAFLTVLTLQVFGRRIFELSIAQIALSTLGLSVGGFALGLIGLKVGRGRNAAKLGAFLNGVVLFCVFVLLPVTFYVSRMLRLGAGGPKRRSTLRHSDRCHQGS